MFRSLTATLVSLLACSIAFAEPTAPASSPSAAPSASASEVTTAPSATPSPAPSAPPATVASATGTPATTAPSEPKITYTDVHVDGPYIAMTFDDGPSAANTVKLLDLLAKKHIKATFFLVGECVKDHPELVKREVAEGHEVGNHSYDHPNLERMSDEKVRSQLQRTDDLIFQACGVKPKIMRPPYGNLSQSQRQWVNKEFGYKVILWDVDPLDWKRPGPSVVANRIISATHSGSIILSHDIHAPTIEAMPQVFDTLLAKGYKFVTVSELLAMDRPSAPAAAQTKPSPAVKIKVKKKATKTALAPH